MLDLKRVREDLQGTIERLETRGGDFSYLNKISDELTDERINNAINKLREDLDLISGVYPEFNVDDYPDYPIIEPTL